MAIDFPDGSDNEIDIGNASILQITGAITVMCWAKMDVGGQDITFASKYAAGNRGWALQTDDDGEGGMFAMFFIAMSATGPGKGSGWSNWPTGMVANQLYHLAGVFVPSTAVQIYQDGALGNEKTAGIPATMYDPTNNVIVGGKADPTQNPDGKLYDFRIYNRALGAAEIATIHASRGRDRIVDGIVCRLMMNEKHSGQTVSGAGSVKDCSRYANHGTPVGSLTYAESAL